MAAVDREIPAEDSIKVVCRFRPLNDSEERAGSKFVVKFPQGQEENCISIGVSTDPMPVTFHRFSAIHPRKIKNRKSPSWIFMKSLKKKTFSEGKTFCSRAVFTSDNVASRLLS